MMGYVRDKGIVFPRAALFEIMIGVVGALDAAYNGRPLQGGDPLCVIHRDIKPSNIFVTVNSAIKVLDFGTARANFAEREAKTQALAFGSQGYMAPERMLGEEDSPAGDIFSLGISLYELLTLENFGRIPPRPNKFAAKMEDRVASIPLEGDEDWCAQIRDTLRAMMAYEPDDRPPAKKLLETFEVLAQNADDIAFRRFCRTMVTEAKSIQPDMDTGDPLTGTVINEDRSSTWQVGSDGAPQLESPEETTLTGGAIPQPVGLDDVRQNTGTPVRAPQRNEPLPPKDFGPIDEYESPKKSGMGKIIAGVAAVVVLGVVLVVVAIVIAGMMYFQTPDGATSTASVEKTVTQEETAPPPSDLPEGGKIVKEGNSSKNKSRSTILKTTAENGATVKITDIFGFEALWDGKGEFDLGRLPEGTYKATIKIPNGKTHRAKSFKVASRKTCTYTFDVSKSSWDGSCK
jgi:serine/threonine protein kinase